MTPRQAQLLGLADRCEKAGKPDREVDGLLHVRFDLLGRSRKSDDQGRYTIVGPPTYETERHFFCPDTEMDWIGYDLFNVSPNYTASLDAAVSLCERVLPDHRILIDSDHDRRPLWRAYVRPRGADRVPAYGASAPLALLAATLRAAAQIDER